MYKNKLFKTTIKEDGGINSVWDEEFLLDKVAFNIDDLIVFDVRDEELFGHRLLGNTSNVLTIKDYIINYVKDFKPV